MSEEEIRKLYEDLCNFYGERHQCLLCIEEMSELTKELIKHERGHFNHYEIAEEVADVLIMIEQIIYIYDIAEAVEQWKQVKRFRTYKRLAEDHRQVKSDG